MATFPKKDADILALANSMVAGYTEYPEFFPHADVTGLTDVREEFKNAWFVEQCISAMAKLATETKDTALQDLVTEMNLQLRQSEIDTADNPKQLDLIGWGEKSAPKAMPKPGQPRLLEGHNQGPGALELDWKSPAPNHGGEVRSYVILRRDQGPGGILTQWTQVGMALNTQLILTGQPRFTPLEYRVIAVNTSGISLPSNTVALTL